MFLTRTADCGHECFRTGTISFWMSNGDKTVRCAVSKYALDRLENVLFLQAEHRMSAFKRHRTFIEALTSLKYHAQKVEKDGKSILIDELDILLAQAANDVGEEKRKLSAA